MLVLFTIDKETRKIIKVNFISSSLERISRIYLRRRTVVNLNKRGFFFLLLEGRFKVKLDDLSKTMEVSSFSFLFGRAGRLFRLGLVMNIEARSLSLRRVTFHKGLRRIN